MRDVELLGAIRLQAAKERLQEEALSGSDRACRILGAVDAGILHPDDVLGQEDQTMADTKKVFDVLSQLAAGVGKVTADEQRRKAELEAIKQQQVKQQQQQAPQKSFFESLPMWVKIAGGSLALLLGGAAVYRLVRR